MAALLFTGVHASCLGCNHTEMPLSKEIHVECLDAAVFLYIDLIVCVRLIIEFCISFHVYKHHGTTNCAARLVLMSLVAVQPNITVRFPN